MSFILISNYYTCHPEQDEVRRRGIPQGYVQRNAYLQPLDKSKFESQISSSGCAGTDFACKNIDYCLSGRPDSKFEMQPRHRGMRKQVSSNEHRCLPAGASPPFCMQYIFIFTFLRATSSVANKFLDIFPLRCYHNFR